MEVRARNAIVAAQMALRLAPEILDTIDVVVTLDKSFGVVGAAVVEFRHIENIVGAESIRVDDAIRFDALADDPGQGRRAGVGNHHRMHFAGAFQQAENRHFAGSAAAALAFAGAPEIALVDLHFAA